MKSYRLDYKIFMIVFLLLGGGLFYYLGGKEFLSFGFIKQNLIEIQLEYQINPWWVLSLFIATYLFLTIFAIPGSIVLTVLSGAVFGSIQGVVIVSCCGTFGATLSFLISRYVLRDYLNEKFQAQFELINDNLKREGILYLFVLRFIPVSPFVVINLVMGLTYIKVWSFFWTTFLGMIPGNIIYVYAGKRIAEIESATDIMTPTLIIGLTLLGLLPLVARKILQIRKKQ